ncbi:T-cell surface glycoprotein CD5 isoform X2 [Protopterus annectens]|uniref:T-cell surface glycoprotein CD5 isoform X2 n=1 Tax=Protopterus annectens TaxID=7888 RepID=UPI001CFB8766|nr:T-cell surface glycoprotein CD5 isoform X2 [Protopterus annectens]
MALLVTVTLSMWILVLYSFLEPGIHSLGGKTENLSNKTNCQSVLEIRYNDQLGEHPYDAKMLDFTCAMKSCTPDTAVTNITNFIDGALSMLNITCLRAEDSLIKCNVQKQYSINSSHHQVSIECKDNSEHIPTVPPPPEPLQLRLIGPDNCSGVLEVYKNHKWGTVSPTSWTEERVTSVCHHLNCGNYLDFGGKVLNEKRYSPLRWSLATESCRGGMNEDSCFTDQDNPEKNIILSMVCSASTLKLPIRMVKSNATGEEHVEVFFENSWQVFCNNDWEEKWANEVCRDHGCMRSKLFQSKNKPIPPKTLGVSCLKKYNDLKDCHHFIFKVEKCLPATLACDCVEVHGFDTSTGVAITFGLILLFVLLIIIGPPFYRIVRKRFRLKKQRQWIGPTEAGHNALERISTVSVQPHENLSDNSEYDFYDVRRL